MCLFIYLLQGGGGQEESEIEGKKEKGQIRREMKREGQRGI